MEGVKSMLGGQMDRHKAVSDVFVNTRDGCKRDLEAEVAARANELRVSKSSIG